MFFYIYKSRNSVKVNSSLCGNSSYRLFLSDFNLSEMIGSENSCKLFNSYLVKGSNIKINGFPTISLARAIVNQSIDMYSIGLEVGNNVNAQSVKKDSQNKGYFTGMKANLFKMFINNRFKLNYGTTNAVVTDSMGKC